MVTFSEDTFLPLVVNNNDGNHMENVQHDLDKKRYRMTPHPSSGRAGKEDSFHLDAFVSSVDSPEFGRSHESDHAQHGDTEAEKENDKAAFGGMMTMQDDVAGDPKDDEWKQWAQKVYADGKAPPNLEAYMSAKEARDDAKQAFMQVLEECLNAMARNAAVELLESAGVVYREQGERLEAHEASIMDSFQSNHERRTRMIQQVEHANADWNSRYKKMRVAILNSDENEDEGATAMPAVSHEADGLGIDHGNELSRTTGLFDDSEGLDVKMASRGSDGNTMVEGETGEDVVDEPNWNAISEFPPSRENVKCFLAAREKLRVADEGLLHAMDVIYAGLKADSDAMAQIVLDCFDHLENIMTTLEQDIQFHLMTNYQRREAFQDRLEETSKQAQDLIKNLLSRLGHGGY